MKMGAEIIRGGNNNIITMLKKNKIKTRVREKLIYLILINFPGGKSRKPR